MSATDHIPHPDQLRERDVIAVRRALLSVSDKTGLVELGRGLADAGVELVSTGSTAATLRDAGLTVTDVASITGFPESLDGRVKTLHPAIHGGLLADLRRTEHERELAELGIRPFELLVSNLYPFVQTVASGAEGDAVVEQIDIGGPAMVRASAKNHANVAIVVSPERYSDLLAAVHRGGTTMAERRELAADAFAHTAAYDTAVAEWFAAQLGGPSAASDALVADSESAPATAPAPAPASVTIEAQLVHPLRYGENAHQTAALYAVSGAPGIAQAVQHGGKEMSYNNFVDADAAVRAAYDFDEPAVAVIKHANPCGIAVDDTIAAAHSAAHACDPVSAYGGVIAANREVTVAMAETVKGIFTEVIVAPSYEPAALALLQMKKSLRILELPDGFARPTREFRQLSGGLLVQDPDRFVDVRAERWQLVSGDPADASTRRDLEFAWVACRAVKSNAILLANAGASVGIGMGQVNRVDSCQLAVQRAGERASGSVAASDAFFPFPDGLQILIDAGVRAVVQPGGSIHDPEVLEAARSAQLTMYLTGERHFFH